jgi:DNA replication protein DnaC
MCLPCYFRPGINFCTGSIQNFNKICLLTSKSALYRLRAGCRSHQRALNATSDEGNQKSPSQNSGPLAVLKDKINNGEIMHDDYQNRITYSLQCLYENIQGYTPPMHGLLSRLLKKTTKAPKGLYIYGAVGGGKTMLMDLFYSCCKVPSFILALIRSDSVLDAAWREQDWE